MLSERLWSWREQLRDLWRVSQTERFLRWWGQELRACLPVTVRQRLLRESNEQTYHWPLPHTLPTTTPGSQSILQLPADLLLVQSLTLPLAAARDLRSVLTFEMDRFTPFKADQVYFVTRREGLVAGQLHVSLSLVLRESLDQCLDECLRRGLRIDRVDGLDERGQRLGIDFMPTAHKDPARRSGRRLTLRLLLLCAGLLLLLMALDLRQNQIGLSRMQTEVSALHKTSTSVGQLRRNLDDAQNASAYLSQLKQAQPSRASILSELTGCLPTDAWLESLQITAEGQVDFSGLSAHASGLINQIKACPSLLDGQFQGVIQPDPESGKDRFHFRAQVRREVADGARTQRR